MLCVPINHGIPANTISLRHSIKQLTSIVQVPSFSIARDQCSGRDDEIILGRQSIEQNASGDEIASAGVDINEGSGDVGVRGKAKTYGLGMEGKARARREVGAGAKGGGESESVGSDRRGREHLNVEMESVGVETMENERVNGGGEGEDGRVGSEVEEKGEGVVEVAERGVATLELEVEDRVRVEAGAEEGGVELEEAPGAGAVVDERGEVRRWWMVVDYRDGDGHGCRCCAPPAPATIHAMRSKYHDNCRRTNGLLVYMSLIELFIER